MILPKARAVVLISMLILTSGCLKKELTPEEKALVSNLRSELLATDENLRAAKSQNERLSGGLLKALTTVRIEILETNSELIKQRINAVESGAPIKQVTTISNEDPGLAKKLEAEIAVQKSELQAAQNDAQLSGGLVGVMKAVTAATKEQTVAMLQQRYLSAKYGLVASPLPQQPAVALEAAPSDPSRKQEPEIPAGNGPFGLQAGASKEIIERMTGSSLELRDKTQSLYSLSTPPNPNDSFESYGLIISPTVGLCQIRAIGKTINSNDYGHQLKSAFDNLKDALTSVYGKPEVLDLLMPGSLWKNSNEWMMGLYKQDRSLIAEWNSSNTIPFKSDIKRITMAARAENSSTGYIMVQYSFTNQPTCEAEQKRRSTGSL